MMTSTPVARSRAWMLRPSLPMTRPLSSSLGSGTVVMVRSAVWSEAMRSMAVTSIICARVFGLFLGFVLELGDEFDEVALDVTLGHFEQLVSGVFLAERRSFPGFPVAWSGFPAAHP